MSAPADPESSGEVPARGSIRPGRSAPGSLPAATPAPTPTRVGSGKARGSLPAAGGTLMRAAEAAAVSPTAGTVHDVLAGAAFGHYAEGLRQYLYIRVGEPEKAARLFSVLRDKVARLSAESETLLSPPGVRARVYRMARELADGDDAPRKQTGTIPWYAPPAGKPAYRAALTRVREGLDADARELLELRFARDLGPAEIAFVRGEEEAAVAAALQRAEAAARQHVAGGGDDLPRALLEAFALERLENEFQSPRPQGGRAKKTAATMAGTPGAKGDAELPSEPRAQGELPPLPIGTVVDLRYRLDKHVGSGGFADVYRATDVAVPGHRVALKLLKRPAATEEQRGAALRELRMTAAVFHPSIVQFKDHGWIDDRFWFVMPWYEGESLEDRIGRGALSRAEARELFEPLAQALATMHAGGIRHQDIKPDNIFLAKIRGFGLEDGDDTVLPVLLDLGVAASDADRVLAGTPTYFAPEVAAQFAYMEGDPLPSYEVGHAADVFSLALTLRNALEPGTQPEVVGGNVDAFIRDRAQFVPSAPGAKDLRFLQGDFARWMSADPGERPSAETFAAELARLTEPEEKRARRGALLRVIVPIAIALIAVFGTVAYELQLRAAASAQKAEDLTQRLELVEDDAEAAEQARDALAASVRDAQSEIQAAQLSRQELESQLADARVARDAAQAALGRQRKGRRDAERALETRESELASARTELRQSEQRLASAERESETRASQLAAARTEVEALAGRARNAETARDAAAAELRNAETALERARAQLTSAQQETLDARRQTQRVQQQLDASEARVAQLERQLAAAQRAARSRPASTGNTGSSGSTTTAIPMVSTGNGQSNNAQSSGGQSSGMVTVRMGTR